MLVIPPGWEKIKVSTDPLDKIQAICKDKKGRLQYIYHPVWSVLSRALKLRKLKEFVKNYRKIRTCDPDDHPAWVLRIMLETNIRIGNEKYKRDNGSYGITTLSRKHVFPNANKSVSLKFPGKSGIMWDTRVPKGPLSDYIMRRISRLKSNDAVFPVSPGTVRKRFREIFSDSSPKMIRTYNANKTLYNHLNKAPSIDKTVLKEAIEKTAKKLNHSPAICKNDYICHEIIGFFEGNKKTRGRSFAHFIRGL